MIKYCKDCEERAYPLGRNTREDIWFCNKKESRITINDICERVPYKRYYEFSIQTHTK